MLDVLGQDRATAALRAPLEGGRFPHALVFHGPAGIGKATAAVALARVLLCHDRPADSAQACGSCASCQLLARDADPDAASAKASGGQDPVQRALSAGHPDLHVIVKELALYSDDAAARKRKLMSIPVDVVRKHLIEPAFRSDRLGHGKVFLLDEAELLNPAGQNALLKTLEEPPDRGAGCVIVLVTSSPDKLLPTIRSRCRMVGFGPLSDQDVRSVVAGWPGVDSSKDEIDRAVRFASGSPGRAGLALDYGLTTWVTRVLGSIDAMPEGRPGAGLGAGMYESIQAFAEAWVKNHAQASKDAANRRGFELMTALIAEHARRKLAEHAGALPAGEDDAVLLERDAQLGPWMGLIDAVREAEGWVAAHVNLSMACEGLARSAFEALRPVAAAR